MAFAVTPLVKGTPDWHEIVNGNFAAVGAELGNKANRPNWLIDWYFTDPVNQRRVSGTVTTAGYFIDCWKLISGSVQLTAAGLVLDGTMAQTLETAPLGDYTATALTTAGVMEASFDRATKTISITGTGQTFIAAKLEDGAEQTLARQDASGAWVLNDSPPNRASELSKCQRYLRPLYLLCEQTNYYSSLDEKRVAVFKQFSSPMRTNPTVLNIEDLGYTPVKNHGYQWVKTQKQSPEVRSFGSGKGIAFIVRLPDDFSYDLQEVGLVSYSNDGIFSPLWLSAEL